MAVTHADIEIHGRGRKLGSKAGTAVIVLCIFCGILGFVFSVFAECWKTKASWVRVASEGGKERLGCVYGRNGQVALLCGVGGFLTLAIGMIVQHSYMWAAVATEKQEGGPSIQLTIWDVDSSTGLLAKQAALLFLTSWVCFGVAEVLLVIGIAVESTHLKRWNDTRSRCIVARRGSFLAAGVFSLSTMFLATAFYFVVLKMKRVKEGEASIRREVVEAALFSNAGSATSNMVMVSPNSAQELLESEGGIEHPPAMDRVGIAVKASNPQ
ncbi:hypothetical protein AAC387_Pa05g3003 [Persea americana]